MASRKFRFVSPGVFLREVDNSQLPGLSEAIGPVIIGRTRKGPAMKPHKVKSLEELERVFGIIFVRLRNRSCASFGERKGLPKN